LYEDGIEEEHVFDRSGQQISGAFRDDREVPFNEHEGTTTILFSGFWSDAARFGAADDLDISLRVWKK
jgi:hypothetical protein